MLPRTGYNFVSLLDYASIEVQRQDMLNRLAKSRAFF
ncbi:Uncharacterised protein [Grimontia hollisae]|uniref:Uncharacterized protein n=1 Tax=Grimontia hollisae TaxID=673 RepID=A0A377HJI5_GRIHO|nr:Uncharacterised protein [Grimontia hollisae]